MRTRPVLFMFLFLFSAAAAQAQFTPVNFRGEAQVFMCPKFDTATVAFNVTIGNGALTAEATTLTVKVKDPAYTIKEVYVTSFGDKDGDAFPDNTLPVSPDKLDEGLKNCMNKDQDAESREDLYGWQKMSNHSDDKFSDVFFGNASITTIPGKKSDVSEMFFFLVVMERIGNPNDSIVVGGAVPLHAAMRNVKQDEDGPGIGVELNRESQTRADFSINGGNLIVRLSDFDEFSLRKFEGTFKAGKLYTFNNGRLEIPLSDLIADRAMFQRDDIVILGNFDLKAWDRASDEPVLTAGRKLRQLQKVGK